MSPSSDSRSGSMSSDDSVLGSHTVDATFPLQLPSLSLSKSPDEPDRILGRRHTNVFEPATLAAAIACGCSLPAIKRYLQHYERSTVSDHIDNLVKDQPIVAYTVERNNPELLELILNNGAKASVKVFGRLPVLAFAIMRT
ncbi:hypothetical protein LTR85_002567 [Meristemomyces frigidus]|nr:hypothetical protein LTR85_002567 [Meristemomyces frigidus]